MQTLFSHILLLTLFALTLSVHAQIGGPKGVPKPNKEWIEDIRIDQRLGDSIPLDLPFKNVRGESVDLGQYVGDKPVILSLVYYECPTLCNQVLNSMLRALNVLTFDIGTQFEVVTVSIDPNEKPSLAAAKKAEYLKNYRGDNAALGWHFLTGEQDQIAQLAEAVGFNYRYDEASEQYLHASAIMVLTPDGKLARYFYGIDYPPRDLRWGLVEAANGAIGSPVDQLLLFCYSYDPMTGKYGLFIRNSLRVAGLATVVVLGSFIFVMLRRERKDEPLSLN
jgi:protein SCO1/2